MLSGRSSSRPRATQTVGAARRKTAPAKEATVSIDKTLSKGLRLIEMLAKNGHGGISELATNAGYTKSNVHRLLQTLCRAGWARQTADQGSYELSFKLWELAQDWLLRFDLPRIAAPWLAQLATETEETVHLAVREQSDVVFIATLETPKPVRIHAPLGSRAPAHCTATGKAILAFLPESDLKLVCQQLDSPTTKRLLIDLERTRKRGYALNNAEWQDSVNGVAAPVFMGSSATVIASVGVFGPAIRLNQSAVRQLAPAISLTAKAISGAIGKTVPGPR
jgi:IclR family transcriptional regulator, KDG regulon repressor